MFVLVPVSNASFSSIKDKSDLHRKAGNQQGRRNAS